MGWKKIKEHYRCGHIVQVNKKGICIGSPYIHDIMIISLDGSIQKRYEGRGDSNIDLTRYQSEMDADPELLKSLVSAKDEFGKLTTVYTFDGGTLLEKQCEKIGWPNVTTDGLLMYENQFSTDRAVVLQWAKKNAAAWVQQCNQVLTEIQQNLIAIQSQLAKAQAAVVALDAIDVTEL